MPESDWRDERSELDLCIEEIKGLQKENEALRAQVPQWVSVPEVPGHYWERGDECKTWQVSEVYSWVDGAELLVRCHPVMQYTRKHSIEWYGPIAPPAEQEAPR